MKVRILSVGLKDLGTNHWEPEPNTSAEDGTPVFEARGTRVVSTISEPQCETCEDDVRNNH